MKPKSEILVGIYTCPKYQVRANGIRETWLRLIPDNMRVLFVFGRPDQEASVEGDCLYLDCPEAYEKLPHKTLAFLQYCSAHLEYDYIFKTDDDTYIDLERFTSFDTQGGDYIGQFCDHPDGVVSKIWHYGKCTDKSYEVPDESEFICGWATGGGYFLSRKAVDIAIEKIAHTFSTSLFEDKMVGEALTLDPRLKVIRSQFSNMGIVNPLLPKDMHYLQRVLFENQSMANELKLLREENLRLRERLG